MKNSRCFASLSTTCALLQQSVVSQPRSESLPQVVPVQVIDAGSLDGLLKPVAGFLGGENAPRAIRIVAQSTEGCRRRLIQRKVPGLTVLTEPLRRQPALRVDVNPSELVHSAASKASIQGDAKPTLLLASSSVRRTEGVTRRRTFPLADILV